MDMNDVIAMQDREAADRAALLATLPQEVQAVFNALPAQGRHYLLDKVQILADGSKESLHWMYAGMFIGAIGYAYARKDLDSAAYACLCDFEQTLTAPPA